MQNTFTPEGALRCRAGASGLLGPGGKLVFYVSYREAGGT